MLRLGLCCISLDLKEQGYSFKKMTYKRFSSLPRKEALIVLGEIIYNNLFVTEKTIRYCGENNLCYRMSSDLFPLITYDVANVDLTDLPNHEDIQDILDTIEQTIKDTKVRISAHPSEYNVLASKNQQAVSKTIDELNFYSSFMDRIGCPADHNSPMNLHIHNKDGSYDEIIGRFLDSFSRLDENCRARLTIENDDKLNCWSVKELVEFFHPKTKIPITFDYLHNKCHPDGLIEEEAFNLCHATWGGVKPLFHYSESREGNNPRAHADYAEGRFKVYDEVDLDFELKMKDKAIARHKAIMA
jgi:UV DNA damage endonuclease